MHRLSQRHPLGQAHDSQNPKWLSMSDKNAPKSLCQNDEAIALLALQILSLFVKRYGGLRPGSYRWIA